jgi:hypothetical protein
MINRQALLADLQKFLQRIEADLLERSESTEVPEVPAALRAEYEKASRAERTAQNYEDWRTDTITQAAAAWVLSCVFVRFLEDNLLIDPPKIAGPGERLARARDEHELYFRSHPQHTDREYLLSIFGELAKLPGTKGIFGEHNAINDLPNWLSGDAAGELLNFFQKIDASTGDLVHDFTDPNWNTRFLGDLYQDLSEAARKKFALLQTPDFVEEFILDRTLDPAIEEFGLIPQPSGNEETSATRFKMIDPACGSGHFLLGAFPRLLVRWQRKEPGTNIRELTQRSLDSIHGVDINPFAVAIARFRLLLVAMKSCEIWRLADAPAFHVDVSCGDSLLHGENRTSTGQKLWEFAEGATDQELYSHAYPGEDLQTVRTMLRPNSYHCVVANPPYIVPKDRKLNDWYRRRFSACHMKYSLAVPFMQQIYQLAVRGGYTGQITANSFMKREFGKKLIESFFPTVNLTHVIDTKGAYIPGHATPTVVLFGRHELPVSTTLRTVMGIRGEPSTPDDPARGLVWSAILSQLDRPGSESEFVSAADSQRDVFHKHPWSIGGGGAAELKEILDTNCSVTIKSITTSIGITSFTLADDFYFLPLHELRRRKIPSSNIREMVVGDTIRDWRISQCEFVLFPYDSNFLPITPDPLHKVLLSLWPARALVSNNKMFGGKTKVECGLKWYEYGRLTSHKLQTPLSITFANVASHNHFVLDRGGRIFECHAPIIKLAPEANEDDHLAILGVLNSSTTCFWLKQVMQPKQMTAGDGVRIDSAAKVPHEFSSTQLSNLPLPPNWDVNEFRPRITVLARETDRIAARLAVKTPGNAIAAALSQGREPRDVIVEYEKECTSLRRRMVLLQEELDFVIYAAYGLAGADLIGDKVLHKVEGIAEGERPFSIIQQHNQEDFAVPTAIPTDWPEEFQSLWKRRMDAIKTCPNLRVIEDPNYKRRWIGRQGKYNHIQNTDVVKVACEEWLLDRLESYFDFDGRMNPEGQPTSKIDLALISVAKLADFARNDSEFLQVGELFRDDVAFEMQPLVMELVVRECIPQLPALRYKPSGLIKRRTWERTWDLQRQEDAIVARTMLPSSNPEHLSEVEADDLKRIKVGDIPVPAKYDSKDFFDSNVWRLRGKFDVPKERWISFPHCEGPDGTLVICWAGYDQLQQAQAISAYYVRVQAEFGGSDDPRLIPLLASLIELLPWLKQWHNEPNAKFDGLRMGDYFESFVNEEARNLGKTLAEIKAWVPPKNQTKTNKKRLSSKKQASKKKTTEATEEN